MRTDSSIASSDSGVVSKISGGSSRIRARAAVLQKELKKTIVFITHDLDEALRLGDNIVILRDGSIVQQGDSQDILLRPADDYIERFIKDVNRGRYLRVESVMEAGVPKTTTSTMKLRSGTTLEAAALELGALSMLRKPIPVEILRITVEQIIQRRSKGQS